MPRNLLSFMLLVCHITKCEELINAYKQANCKEDSESIKQRLNGLLIAESIRFSEIMFSEQYHHIANKVKDAVSTEFGQELANPTKVKICELAKRINNSENQLSEQRAVNQP